jgi:hypothetical protein
MAEEFYYGGALTPAAKSWAADGFREPALPVVAWNELVDETSWASHVISPLTPTAKACAERFVVSKRARLSSSAAAGDVALRPLRCGLIT